MITQAAVNFAYMMDDDDALARLLPVGLVEEGIGNNVRTERGLSLAQNAG
jgi:hypothetical protein